MFSIPACTATLLDLSSLHLETYLQVKKKDGTDLTPADKESVCLTNIPVDALFSTVEVRCVGVQ